MRRLAFLMMGAVISESQIHADKVPLVERICNRQSFDPGTYNLPLEAVFQSWLLEKQWFKVGYAICLLSLPELRNQTGPGGDRSSCQK